METSTLRWIMIIIGVLILGSIFLFGNPEKRRRPRASRRASQPLQERQEPTLEGGDSVGETAADESGAPGQRELDIEPAFDEDTTAHNKGASGPAPEKIVSLFLMARDNHIINGAELLQAALSAGMEFGEMNIFHRKVEGSEQAVFSMANAAKPGSFDREAWNTFETSGVVLFLTLPGPVQALDGWDSMLATARRISEILHAELLDEDRNRFIRQTEARIREELRNFDRGKPDPS